MSLSSFKDLLFLNIRLLPYRWAHFWFKLAPYLSPLLFLIHWYPIVLFRPKKIQNNVKVLVQYQKGTAIKADKWGNLRLLRGAGEKFRYYILNICSLGAYRARAHAALYFTFFYLTLEYLNPFSRDVLIDFLQRKKMLMNRLIERLPFTSKDRAKARRDLKEYLIGSYLQLHIIHKVHLAAERESVPLLVQQAQEGLKEGRIPRLAPQGAAGAYLMRSCEGKTIGLFKPFDEELKAPNNPVGPSTQGALGRRGARLGSRVGEGCHHEVAACIVDQFLGFGLVPKTYYAVFEHPSFYDARSSNSHLFAKNKRKYGSFQEFIDRSTPLSEATEEMVDHLSIEAIHRLIVLDAIIGNLDRNDNNILICEGRVIAIDHGLCFPDRVTGELTTWIWRVSQWGERDFSGPLIALIKGLSLERLCRKLHKRCLIEPNQLARMGERVALFRAGVLAGLVPSHLSQLLTKDYLLQLVDVTETRDQRAKELVQNYLDSLKKGVWARLRF